MTRINVVPAEELCDQHLLAEFRELTRIPNCVISGRLKSSYQNQPNKYTLGPGHVKFFTNKLGWLSDRYDELYKECVSRGFSVTYIFPFETVESKALFGKWTPTTAELEEARTLNRNRIKERMPKNARFSKSS